MRILALLLTLAATSALLVACPDPTELGHQPKKQIDKAHKAVDKAEQSMQQRMDKAAKTNEPAIPQE